MRIITTKKTEDTSHEKTNLHSVSCCQGRSSSHTIYYFFKQTVKRSIDPTRLDCYIFPRFFHLSTRAGPNIVSMTVSWQKKKRKRRRDVIEQRVTSVFTSLYYSLDDKLTCVKRRKKKLVTLFFRDCQLKKCARR